MPTRTLPALGALLTTLALTANAALAGTGGLLEPIGGVRFTHRATAANTDGYATFLDHPSLNQNQDAVILVTQNWNPKGSDGVYNDHPVGVYFEPNVGGYWAIYNEDIADIPEGAAFNVLVLSVGPDAAIHTTSAGNTVGNSTWISFPGASGEPHARFFLTHNYNPTGYSGDVHPVATGVWIDSPDWLAYNEDLSAMPADLHFNLAVGETNERTILHVADGSNVLGNFTRIDHPDLNGNPGAWVLVTHNWGAEDGGFGSGGELGASLPIEVYVNANLGVWYDETVDRWAIFDQAAKLGEMPEGAMFNVLIDPHPQLFADDFESGDSDRWSLTFPDDVISLAGGRD